MGDIDFGRPLYTLRDNGKLLQERKELFAGHKHTVYVMVHPVSKNTLHVHVFRNRNDKLVFVAHTQAENDGEEQKKLFDDWENILTNPNILATYMDDGMEKEIEEALTIANERGTNVTNSKSTND